MKDGAARDMNVRLKLFASLADFLPNGAKQNEVMLDVADGQSVGALLDQHNVPRDACHLLLINGRFSPPAEADDVVLKEGDTVAVWPPVAGG